MDIPFTTEQFLDVFRRYNEAVWPAQLVLLILALFTVVLALSGHRLRSRGSVLVLAALWLWMGVAYHLAFFRAINPVATVFGVLFIVQAGIFAWFAWRAPATMPGVHRTVDRVLGGLFITFALAVYPSLGWMAGHRYPSAPTFGLPCPTTIYTFGLLLLARPVLPAIAYAIPVLWSLVGTTAALQLGMTEDFSLLVAAIIAVGATFQGRRRAGVRLA